MARHDDPVVEDVLTFDADQSAIEHLDDGTIQVFGPDGKLIHSEKGSDQ